MKFSFLRPPRPMSYERVFGGARLLAFRRRWDDRHRAACRPGQWAPGAGRATGCGRGGERSADGGRERLARLSPVIAHIHLRAGNFRCQQRGSVNDVEPDRAARGGSLGPVNQSSTVDLSSLGWPGLADGPRGIGRAATRPAGGLEMVAGTLPEVLFSLAGGGAWRVARTGVRE